MSTCSQCSRHDSHCCCAHTGIPPPPPARHRRITAVALAAQESTTCRCTLGTAPNQNTLALHLTRPVVSPWRQLPCEVALVCTCGARGTVEKSRQQPEQKTNKQTWAQRNKNPDKRFKQKRKQKNKLTEQKRKQNKTKCTKCTRETHCNLLSRKEGVKKKQDIRRVLCDTHL
jgi:hypothetical protein